MTISDPEARKPVAIVFANLKGNLGDFAILHAMLLDLKERYPCHPLHVFSHPFHSIDEGRLAEFKRFSPSFVIAGRTFFKPFSVAEKLMMGLKFWPQLQSSCIRSFCHDARPQSARFSDYEAVFVAGGAQWSGKKLGVCMFGTLMAIHERNRNIFAHPFSVKSSIAKFFAPAILKRNFNLLQKPLVVRDGISKSILDQTSIPCVQGVDCVYTLQDLVKDIAPKADRDSSRILFAVKGRPKDLEQSLCKLLPDTPNIELLTTCQPEDEAAYAHLARMFNLPFHAPLSWQETVSEFKASSLTLTNRLHCLILGTFAETPLLPVANRQKTLAFVADARITHYVARVSELSSALVASALKDSQAILERMTDYRERGRNQPRSPFCSQGSGSFSASNPL